MQIVALTLLAAAAVIAYYRVLARAVAIALAREWIGS
jgi:hypothetical protein